MSSFVLEVSCEDDESLLRLDTMKSEDQVELSYLHSSKILFVLSTSLCFFMSKCTLEDQNSHLLAIFVPDLLLELILENLPLHSSKFASQEFYMENDQAFQRRALSLIHPLLVDEPCQIKFIIKSKMKGFPVVILDTSNCPERWITEKIRQICGAPMAACEYAVILFFPLTQIVTSEQNNVTSPIDNVYEVSTCPVCLFRIYPPRLKMLKPRNDQMCSEYCVVGHCQNELFLKPWPTESCNVCLRINSREREDAYCNCCALQETLWICLTCGFVGCGRYSHAHAANHFQETQHAYSLEMATLRIWDYANGEFAHRGDLLECPSTNMGHQSHWVNVTLPWETEKRREISSIAMTARDNDETSPKKTKMLSEEYEALLQSALVDQAQHYESDMSRLHAKFTSEQVDENSMTHQEKDQIEKVKREINLLRGEIKVIGRNLLEAQAQEAGHRAASQRLMNEQGIAKGLLDKIREEAAKEHQQGKLLVEDLEQQIADLTANLKMRHQISQDEELSQAQIYGAIPSDTSRATNGGRRGGKKSRRICRK
jgi:BRCA1-associated protein